MLVKHEGVGFDANFKPESEDFDVEDPTGLIIILRDKLYSDKLRVFIQEYISNARDANREVGRPDHEIEITAPTRSEPLFKVRDFGPGLSPERVHKVFLKFGATTKAGTDKFIGGYGIGAKSGWAYTDSFVVRSFHEGTEYHYLCHLGETPKGSMSKLFVGPTTEPNGVEVQVQVQQDDINRSHELIRYLTKFWPTLPKIHNTTVWQPVMIVDPELPFETIDNEKSNHAAITNLSTLMLVLDGIPYALECPYLTKLVLGLRDHTRTASFIFRAATGVVAVAANREQLEINAKYKAWLLDQIQQVIARLHIEHLEAAKAGLEPYIRFWRRRGRYTQLSRSRGEFHKSAKSALDYEQIQKNETGVMETNYQTIMRHYKKAEESLQELKLLIPAPAPQFPPIMTKMNGFCWYFEKEKVLLVNETLYPLALKDTMVYTRRKAPATYDDFGKRRTRKEMFQLPFKLWEGLILDKTVFHQGIALKVFDKGYGETDESPLSSNYIYNDEPRTPEKLAKITNRIGGKYQYVLEETKIPKWLEALGVRPLSQSLTPIVRYETTRIHRPSGSVRSIYWQDARYGGETFTFASYEEPTTFQNEGEYFEKSSLIIYAWTDESRRKWNPVLLPLVGRMTINDAKFIQLNKKAFKFFQGECPTANLVHWAEWAKTGHIDENKITQIEYEQFAYEWLNNTQYAVLDMLVDENKIRKVDHPLYGEFLTELRQAKAKRGRNDAVGSYFRKNRKIVKSLKSSRIFQLRQQLLKKYPMLPIVEVNLINHEKEKRKDESRQEILNGFLADPRTYMRTRAKQHGDAEAWLRSKE